MERKRVFDEEEVKEVDSEEVTNKMVKNVEDKSLPTNPSPLPPVKGRGTLGNP